MNINSTKFRYRLWLILFILNLATFVYNVLYTKDTQLAGFTGFFAVYTGIFALYYDKKLKKENS